MHSHTPYISFSILNAVVQCKDYVIIIMGTTQLSFAGSFPACVCQARVGLSNPLRKVPLHLRIKCEKTEKEEDSYKNVSVERPPYYSYWTPHLGNWNQTLVLVQVYRTRVLARRYS